jgi:two-component system, cell cycle response regulator
MNYLSPQHKSDLLSRISRISRMNGAIDLGVLIDLLGTEIESLGKFNGYMIYLHDAKSENLVSHKVHYSPEFQLFESTLYQHKVALSDSEQNPNAKAYRQRTPVRVNASNANESEKHFLSIWQTDEFTAIPIQNKGEGTDRPPIGTFFFLNQAGAVDEQILGILDELIALFFQPLDNALEHALLKEIRSRVEAAESEKVRFLKFMIEMNHLTSQEKIYEMFAAEIFRQLAFNGIAFFLAENGLLANKKVAINDPRYQDIQRALEKQLHDAPYRIKRTEGGITNTFLSNMQLTFPDVQKIIHLPMTEKDTQTLGILKTVRTILTEPMCYQGKPIGAIMFFSLADIVPLSDEDLHLISYFSSFLGTTITNSKNYAWSQAQNHQITYHNLPGMDGKSIH